MPESFPVILAIESSQRTGGVALQDRAGAVHVEMFHAELRHDDDLMPAIDRLCTRMNLEPGALDAVGVSVGPGGFTGLRIAVSTAKIFAETLNASIVAVPSAHVAAQAHAGEGPIVVCLASKRESFWASRFVSGDDAGAWIEDIEPQLTDASTELLNGAKAVLADQYAPPALLERCAHDQIEVIEPAFDPGACLIVAARMLAAERTTDPLHLTPMYARRPEAEVLWEQRTKSTRKRGPVQ